jgi:isopentenyl-diphosphate delta-isomerase
MVQREIMEDLNKEEQVVLVDEQNQVLGYMAKLEAHQKALLHRAISVIIFNSKGEMLIQQRALSKYHWAGIWSNTCCSHPRKDESFKAAAERRLFEELGIKAPLKEEFHFIYKAFDEPSGLTEWEYDTVFTGVFDGSFEFNKEEVADIRWMNTADLLSDIERNPGQYSFWFKIILEEMKKKHLI